jgi:hypothetical protein
MIMRHYPLFQQDFGAPPPPPPAGNTPQPPPPPGSIQGEKSSNRAVWALILGIAAWVLGCGILTGIPAWIMGKKELNDIEAGLASPAGKTMAQIGMWLGIINVIVSILVAILIIVLLALGVLGNIINN